MTATNAAPSDKPLDDPDAPAFDIDVGIIYTHETEWMTRLVSTVRRSVDQERFRLVLVDNASSQGVEAWRTRHPATLSLRNERPLGYAENLNRILRLATARYVLLLNTDVYFDPSEKCLAKMTRFMDARPACGVSICRVYHPDGGYAHPARRFQTPAAIAVRRLGLDGAFPRVTDRYLYRDRSRHDAFDCDWVSGCFMMVRRQAMAEVGEFDCGYAKYFEDVDICRRMRDHGWQVMFNGQTYCYHVEQRASRSLLTRDAWRHFRAYLRWLGKSRLASNSRFAA